MKSTLKAGLGVALACGCTSHSPKPRPVDTAVECMGREASGEVVVFNSEGAGHLTQYTCHSADVHPGCLGLDVLPPEHRDSTCPTLDEILHYGGFFDGTPATAWDGRYLVVRECDDPDVRHLVSMEGGGYYPGHPSGVMTYHDESGLIVGVSLHPHDRSVCCGEEPADIVSWGTTPLLFTCVAVDPSAFTSSQ